MTNFDMFMYMQNQANKRKLQVITYVEKLCNL